jgi:hypothetical protein
LKIEQTIWLMFGRAAFQLKLYFFCIIFQPFIIVRLRSRDCDPIDIILIAAKVNAQAIGQ